MPDARVGHGDLDHPVDRRRPDLDPPALRRELDRIGQQVQDHLPDLPLVGADLLQPLIDGQAQCDATPPGPLAHQGQGVVERRGQVEVRQFQLHPARLDLGQVEDVVDQGQEVLSRGVDVLQILVLLLVQLAEHPLAQDLREADDGVQRRPQLVGHVGQELGLVLAGDFELPALVLDLEEQACVLDGQRRLGREGA